MIIAKSKKIGRNIHIGEDVLIECEELILKDNVSIGVQMGNNFRNIAGVRIKVKKLILEEGVSIGREVLIKGGTIHLGRNTKIENDNTINVKEILEIGGYGTVNEHCEISGSDIKIGQELRMLSYAKIGGGSAFDVHSKLRIGHFCHIGMYCLLNTARQISIGDEVGLGTRTCLYTHGAYLSPLNGYPVKFSEISIGDCVWIPGAIINPGVNIGKNCVIGVNSLVNNDIPDGSLAGGVPAKLIKKNIFPKKISFKQKYDFFQDFLKIFSQICLNKSKVKKYNKSKILSLKIDKIDILFKEYLERKDINNNQKRSIFIVDTDNSFPDYFINNKANVTIFHLSSKLIYGLSDSLSEQLMSQLRRYGIRFYSRSIGGKYCDWK